MPSSTVVTLGTTCRRSCNRPNTTTYQPAFTAQILPSIDLATPPREGAERCDVDCPFVCLSARIASKPHDRISPDFFKYTLPMAMDRWSSSDGVGIRLVLPVLWMASSFSYRVAGLLVRIMHDVISRRSSPGDGTSWTSDNYSVWWSSPAEFDSGGEVCYLRLPCFI